MRIHNKSFSVVLLLALILLTVLGAALVPANAVRAETGIWYVDSASGTDDASHGTAPGFGAFKTIQYAIGSATAGDFINVYPGTYNEDEANGYNLITGGSGTANFNIFVNKSVTIQGVNASGVPITNYNDVVAFVIAKRNTPISNLATFFIQADNVTITGLDITAFVDPDYNFKTISVIGDNAIIKYCNLHNLDQVSNIYVYDPNYNAGTNISHIQSYRFEGNYFDAGGIYASGIRFSSGAGWTGDVANRVISGNTFTSGSYGIEFVGPQADPWDYYPVGAATITGNSFSGADKGSVVAWGKYAGVEGYGALDWDGIYTNNIFAKAVIVKTPGGAVRSYDSSNFYFVRGIYNAIQRYPINRVAVAGDTINVAAGTYAEQVVMNKDLTLSGTGNPIIKAPASPNGYKFPEGATNIWEPVVLAFGGTADGSFNITGAGQVTVNISGITVDGNARIPSPTSRRAVGILYRNALGGVEHSTVQNMGYSTTFGNSWGIMAYGTSDVIFHGNTVSGYAKGGFVVNGVMGRPEMAKPHAVIDNNIVTGPPYDPSLLLAPNGIQIGWGATGSVTNNIVTHHGSPGTAWGGTGILIQSSPNVLVEGNSATENMDYGIATSGYETDLSPATGTIIRDNIIEENGWGIYVNYRSVNTLIEDNQITSNDIGIRVGSSTAGYRMNTPPVNTDIHNNAIYGNTDSGVFVVANVLQEVVDATYNWWGVASGPLDDKGLPGTPDYNNLLGTGNKVSSYVDYKPWYTDATMTTVSSAKEISTFNFETPAVTGTIDYTLHTVTLTVPCGTDVTALVPTIAVSAGASVSPASGVANDFTTPQTYTVTAADSSTQAYTVTVTVQKCPATVTLGSLSQTYDGFPKSATATTDPSGKTVDFTYDGSATAPTAAGSYAVVGTINDPNYEGTATGILVISKATPTIIWANPADIVYGTALSATQLNAASPVAGSFVYDPAATTVLGAGNDQNLKVDFTPADTINYSSASKTVTINISKKALTITGNNRVKTYGDAVTFAGTEFTTSGLVDGDTVTSVTLASAGAAASATVVGSPYTITPSAAVGTGLNNYNITYTPGTLTVNKASTVVALTSSANPSFFLQCVTFTSTVTAVAPGAGTPTGTVTFKDGTTTLGTVTLSAGKATYRTPCLRPLRLGDHSITAVYSSDSNFEASTSPVLTQTVLTWLQWHLRLICN